MRFGASRRSAAFAGPGLLTLCLLVFVSDGTRAQSPAPLDEAAAGRFANLALGCIDREFPNKISHVLDTKRDVERPSKLTPAFFGCYDWHSSVHGHWLLARLARLYPTAEFTAPSLAALGRSLTADNLNAEVAYLDGPGRASFERPYGLAWLLQLAAELHEWKDPGARAWRANLAPLELAAADRLRNWLPKLNYPIRAGEHSQSAFALGLALDWAETSGDTGMANLIRAKAREHYLEDTGCPLHYEPSGQDFLSPCLGEADLMRRVLEPAVFAAWLGAFLPVIPLDADADWLPAAIVTDRSDPKLAHLDGLNLSRAWMLEGIAASLPVTDPRLPALNATAAAHRAASLPAVTGEYYEGGHWLGSFATYLTTHRGIRSTD